jgi:hypothetical protein
MPIVIETDGPQPPPTPAPVVVSVPAYRGVTVDTRYTPISSLLTNIEGSPWSVVYYSQVLNNSNAPEPQQLQRGPDYQQYTRINKLELKVTSPLTYSQTEANRNENYVGEANCYPFLRPNVGDMFLADTGDGREGVFTITACEPKSIFTQTCFAISYEMVDYNTAARRADFKAKTIVTYEYVKDFLQYGQNPLVLSSDFASLLSLEEAYPRVLRAWAQEFFSPQFSTFIIPGQQWACYDSFLTQAMLKWMTYDDVPEMIKARALTCDSDEQMQIPTIWDVLGAADIQLMRRITEQAGLVPVAIFNGDPMLEGVRFSGVSYVMYPLDPITTTDAALGYTMPAMPMGVPLTEAPVRRSRLDALIPDPDLDGLPYEGLPLIKNVTVDPFYIFSEAFYTRDEDNQSRLERAVWAYLEGEVIDLNLLNTLLQSYQSWGGLERFYYTPIIALLIKARVRSM